MNQKEKKLDTDRKTLVLAIIRFFSMIRKWKNYLKNHDYRKAHKMMKMIQGLYMTLQSLSSLLPPEYQAELTVLIEAELDAAYDFEKQHFIDTRYIISNLSKRKRVKL